MMRPQANTLLDAEKISDEIIEKYSYDELLKQNLIPYVRPLLQRGWALTLEGKLEARQQIAVDSPWVFAHQDKNRHCDIWHKIFFNMLDFLPSDCLGCWKVVVRPKSLYELFVLREIQLKLGRPSKCGIEVRPTVCGLYGGYFYNDTLQHGEDCWEEVKEQVNRYMEPDTPVILKRGCTEFEAKFGDSRDWEDHITADQVQIERALVEMIPEKANPPQLDMIKPDVMKRWIEWAYQNGDLTYKFFTQDKPLYDPYRIYHDGLDPQPVRRDLPPKEKKVSKSVNLDMSQPTEQILAQFDPEIVQAVPDDIKKELRSKFFALANKLK